MSHIVQQYIECDVKRCAQLEGIGLGETVPEARGRLKQYNSWKTGVTVPGTRGRKFDFCPHHSEADLR